MPNILRQMATVLGQLSHRTIRTNGVASFDLDTNVATIVTQKSLGQMATLGQMGLFATFVTLFRCFLGQIPTVRTNGDFRTNGVATSNQWFQTL